MPLAYRDAVTPDGRVDRAALMRLALAKARREQACGSPWPQALAYALNQVWQSVQARRAHGASLNAFACLAPHEQEAIRCETAALLAETAIPPRHGDARRHREHAAQLRAARVTRSTRSDTETVPSHQANPGRPPHDGVAATYARLAGALKSDLVAVEIELNAALGALSRGEFASARAAVQAARRSAEVGQRREIETIG